MPRYVTPSPSPERSPSPSSRSRSHRRRDSPPRRRPHKQREPEEESVHGIGLIKASMLFIGAVAVASFCAHKYWPKGVLYGDREEWEMEKKREAREERREQQQQQQQQQQQNGRGRPQRSSSLDSRRDGPYREPYRNDRALESSEMVDRRRAGYGPGALVPVGAAAGAAGAGYYADRNYGPPRGGPYRRDDYDDYDDDYYREPRRRPPPVDARDRYYGGGGGGGGPPPYRREYDDSPPPLIERHHTERRETRYYPPQTHRNRHDDYDAPAPRRSSVEPVRRRDYYDEEHDKGVTETVYTVRDTRPAPRRASVDGYADHFEERRAARRRNTQDWDNRDDRDKFYR